MSFNKDSLKNFFVNHTEKVIFGFFVLGFLLMVWSGFSLKPLSITPSQLEESVKRGRQKLESSEPDVSQYTSIDYEKEANLSAKAISPKALSLLEINNDFRHPIAQPQVKRTQPPVLGLTSLQANSGVGFCPDIRNESVPSRSNHNTAKTQLKLNPGVRWVVVTALIPIHEQEALFTKTFQNADVKYPESDKPIYYSFIVEREEINSSGSQGWKPLDVKESVIINRRYSSSGSGNEIVDQSFFTAPPTPISSVSKDSPQAKNLPVPAPMAMSLMTLSKHQWGADCAHLPEIPLVSEVSRNEEPAEDDVYASEFTAHDNVQEKTQNVLYKLFRFFDTKVEGGKKYHYRFKLVLKNPNYNVKAEYVESEAITVNPFIVSDWSQASPVVEVPPDTRLYCLGSRSDNPNSQQKLKLDDLAGPTGQLMILKFDEVKGLEISKNLNKENALPGMILNYYNASFNNLSEDIMREQTSVANFITNDVVLDYSSNVKLTNSSKAKQSNSFFKGLPMPPTRALLMSQDGKIFVLSEDKDKPSVYLKSNRPVLNTSASSSGRGGQNDDRSGGRQNSRRNQRQPADDRGSSGGII